MGKYIPPIIAHNNVKMLNLEIISENLHIITKIYDNEMHGKREQLGLNPDADFFTNSTSSFINLLTILINEPIMDRNTI